MLIRPRALLRTRLMSNCMVIRNDSSPRPLALARPFTFHKSKRAPFVHFVLSNGAYPPVLKARQKQKQSCVYMVQERFSSASAMSNLDYQLEENLSRPPRKRHLCYYYSQGLCTLENDPNHLEKFTHDYPDLSVGSLELKKLQPQPFQYYLVLDLEGMVEILEFPVVMIDTTTLKVVDRFHRFVRPIKMSEARIDEYIEGKYGRWGLDRVWHDTAIPFTKVLKQFEHWMAKHGIWDARQDCKLKHAAFVTCGNWDVKTKIPQQCATSSISLPTYFFEWVNLKDIYLNFYQRRAGGMLAMLRGLQIPMAGTHHVGLDDAHNIARVLQRIIIDGGVVKITAKRSVKNPSEVKFRFKNRV
ncbi:hypothetical protein KP509_32G011400 [Ceratopteris richardii]|uniref:Exonuclease domain-containing protein n=1 Tax=Ceratopteris richardii TaxID=49495 RepID=A0A8T2QQS2_CERRI|nr:hypothetical protein KP509_32G011400 [Ceratopteris richardii]KAH7286533.1 hypothetical protein KP509_32G011400 [Ceratopteris richardii]